MIFNNIFVRVDFRLLHGQIVYSWLNGIKSKTIYILDNSTIMNPIKLASIKFSCPPFIDMHVFSIEEGLKHIIQESYEKKTLLIVGNILDGIKVCEKLGIREMNIGDTLYTKDKIKLYKSVYVNEEEYKILKECQERGFSFDLRQVFESKKYYLQKL